MAVVPADCGSGSVSADRHGACAVDYTPATTFKHVPAQRVLVPCPAGGLHYHGRPRPSSGSCRGNSECDAGHTCRDCTAHGRRSARALTGAIHQCRLSSEPDVVAVLTVTISLAQSDIEYMDASAIHHRLCHTLSSALKPCRRAETDELFTANAEPGVFVLRRCVQNASFSVAIWCLCSSLGGLLRMFEFISFVWHGNAAERLILWFQKDRLCRGHHLRMGYNFHCKLLRGVSASPLFMPQYNITSCE